MDEQQKKAWKSKNTQLQNAYERYRTASTPKSKDEAARLVEIALEYNPFMNYVYDKGGHTTGLVKYGIDTCTEKAISDINEIANE